MLFSQDASSEGVGNVRRLEELGSDWPAMPHGVTGEPHAYPIPFQVLSWKPHALYFPNFASSEKCEAIVRLAKTKLRPSILALRKGETEETTMGIRTSILSMIRTKREEEKRIREKQLKDCLRSLKRNHKLPLVVFVLPLVVFVLPPQKNAKQ